MKQLVLALCMLALAAPVAAETITIGISQIVDHPALNAARQGVIDELHDAGYVEGENLRVLVGNAQGDYSVALSIAQNFRAEGVDLVVSIATPTSQAAVHTFSGTDIPVIFSAVTDPEAAGLLGEPNVTGVSDLIDVRADLELLASLSADIRRVGIVYNPGEANSAVLTDAAREVAPELGLTLLVAAAENSAAVPMAAQSLRGRVDALYVTTDNTVVSALEAVVEVAERDNIPFLMADPTSLERGATLCTGFDYYDHGRMTGAVVVQVLGGAFPADIPVSRQASTQLWLNLDAAERIGFSFPDAVFEQATGLFLNGRKFVVQE